MRSVGEVIVGCVIIVQEEAMLQVARRCHPRGSQQQ